MCRPYENSMIEQDSRGSGSFGTMFRPGLSGSAAPHHGRTCFVLGLTLLVAAALCPAASLQPITLRVGHFPNTTHVPALVAHGLSRKGQGWFEQPLGSEVKSGSSTTPGRARWKRSLRTPLT